MLNKLLNNSGTNLSCKCEAQPLLAIDTRGQRCRCCQTQRVRKWWFDAARNLGEGKAWNQEGKGGEKRLVVPI